MRSPIFLFAGPFLILTLFMASLTVLPVRAAEELIDAEEEIYLLDEEDEDVKDDKIVKKGNVVTVMGDEYHRANFQTMSRIYWNFGFLDIENDRHLDIFFQINECELYEKYHGDEFEWLPMRKTLRTYLEDNKDSFSRKIFFELPIEVGEYNIAKENFTVLSENFSKGSRDFFPHPNYVGWSDNFCGFSSRRSDSKLYPRDVLFKFIRPMTVPNIRVDRDAAKDLVRDWKERDGQKRFLGIRLRMEIIKFLEYKDVSATKLDVPVFLTYVDGYEIYDSIKMENLLYARNLKRKKVGMAIEPE